VRQANVQPEALTEMHILDEEQAAGRRVVGWLSVIALLQDEPSENVAA